MTTLSIDVLGSEFIDDSYMPITKEFDNYIVRINYKYNYDSLGIYNIRLDEKGESKGYGHGVTDAPANITIKQKNSNLISIYTKQLPDFTIIIKDVKKASKKCLSFTEITIVNKTTDKATKYLYRKEKNDDNYCEGFVVPVSAGGRRRTQKTRKMKKSKRRHRHTRRH